MERLAVELRNITKTFGKAVANRDVNLQVKSGTIHGLVGENGAGKSTAMKVLFGLYQPSAGEIFFEGEKRVWDSPKAASAAGIGMVHQHFMLSPVHTVLDNIILGIEPSGSLINARFMQPIDRAHARTELRVIMKMFDLMVPLEKRPGELPVGMQQRIEILKVLYRKARVLILDEPTAVLTPQETEAFLLNLKKLKDEGKTIIIITHKLREILAVADHITVMRQGEVVKSFPVTAELSEASLAEMMVGRPVRLSVNLTPCKASSIPLVELKQVSYRCPDKTVALKEVSFALHGGEILGVAGVEGSGQKELFHLLSHPRKASKGLIKGQINFTATKTPYKMLRNIDLRRQAMAFIPADRVHEGLLPSRTLLSNFSLSLHFRSAFQGRLGLRWSALRKAAEKALQTFDVRPRDLWADAQSLSGGNQQKLIFARELEVEPRILIAANPTRGVDVGSIEIIHDEILKARERGAGILLVSSELSEVLGLSDRVMVLCNGKVAGLFKRGELNEKQVGILMGGAEIANDEVSAPQVHEGEKSVPPGGGGQS